MATKLISIIFEESNQKTIDSFYYHATNMDNLFGIIETGFLETHLPDYGTEQDEWPDGSIEKRSYFGTSVEHVEPFYPAEGKRILIRIPKNAADFKKERYTKDIYTTENIPVSSIEIWSPEEQTWLNTKQWYIQFGE